MSKEFIRHEEHFVEERDVDNLLKLCKLIKIENNNDALFIAAHYAMIEMDFVPKGFHCDECYKKMPSNYKRNTLFEMSYYHVSFPEIFCQVVAIPMNQVLIFHSNICGGNVDHVLDLNVKEESNFKDNILLHIHIRNLYCNLSQLLLKIKDYLVYPLLCDFYENSGIEPRFTLVNLSTELKYQILTYLPAKSLIALSSVNKEFNDLTNSETLWEKLFAIDFPKALTEDYVKQFNWKHLYREEYIKQKEKLEKNTSYFWNTLYNFPMPSRSESILFPRILSENHDIPLPPLNPFLNFPVVPRPPPSILDAFPQLDPRQRHNSLQPYYFGRYLW